MKLYELPRGASFKILSDTRVPTDALAPTTEGPFTLETLDGMYSRCHDSAGNLYHLCVSTEVVQLSK